MINFSFCSSGIICTDCRDFSLLSVQNINLVNMNARTKPRARIGNICVRLTTKRHNEIKGSQATFWHLEERRGNLSLTLEYKGPLSAISGFCRIMGQKRRHFFAVGSTSLLRHSDAL